MKSIKKIYFIILGMILFGVLTVSASMMLQPDEVSFTSDKTSQTTVKGALDELYDISRGECPVGHVCTTCGVGTYANQTTMECVTCPSGYTSDAGAGKESDCYIETTAGKYIAKAKNSTQTTCPAGSYCPSTKIHYGNIGNIITCPSNTPYSSAGSSRLNSCKTETYKYRKEKNNYTAEYTCNRKTNIATMNSCTKPYALDNGVCPSCSGTFRIDSTYCYCSAAISNCTSIGLPATESCS